MMESDQNCDIGKRKKRIWRALGLRFKNINFVLIHNRMLSQHVRPLVKSMVKWNIWNESILTRVFAKLENSRSSRELREFFNYATPLVIMLSFYMFQFTMLFTSWCICSDNIVTSDVALLIRLALTLKTSLEFLCVFTRRTVSIVNVFFPRPLV